MMLLVDDRLVLDCTEECFPIDKFACCTGMRGAVRTFINLVGVWRNRVGDL